MQRRPHFIQLVLITCSMLMLLPWYMEGTMMQAHAQAMPTHNSLAATFEQTAHATNVPAPLLKAICYLEGRLSNHSGSPSIDGGYGCMHLLKNKRVDTLDLAAHSLGVSTNQIRVDLATNIRGGAVVLRNEALHLSPHHVLPSSLAGWYGAIASYSHATTISTARMYADAVYKLLNRGFQVPTSTGETITLSPQRVIPDLTSAAHLQAATTLPQGCVNDGKTDYPGAVDCILDPASYDCNLVPANTSCTYEDAQRPTSYALSFIAIHDIEGTAQDALSIFQDPTSSASIHYIVDSDGTIYEVLHEKDIAYHLGNYWYNQRSIGIEHAGFDATGYQWYNATEYLSSARLVAYLTQKYHIPPDHDHVVSHGTIPAPTLTSAPNHVDPGPYWLWDYYLGLIQTQITQSPHARLTQNTITLHPTTDHTPFGPDGTETSDNFNFFYLYNGPSTASGSIPYSGNSSDITDETNSIEPAITYYYQSKVLDPAGTGDILYEIWYGAEDHHQDPTPNFFANAQRAWLAVPPGMAIEGQGTLVKINFDSAKIYGQPTTKHTYQIGDAPQGAIFVSSFTMIEEGTHTLWYAINYNHRQAWVAASEVTTMP